MSEFSLLIIGGRGIRGTLKTQRRGKDLSWARRVGEHQIQKKKGEVVSGEKARKTIIPDPSLRAGEQSGTEACRTEDYDNRKKPLQNRAC